MKPHEERVVAERAELTGRIDRLGVFMNTPTFVALPEADRELLFQQQVTMLALADILRQRIARFPKD